jgi:hypothetical protein
MTIVHSHPRTHVVQAYIDLRTTRILCAEVDERGPARGWESGASQILHRGIQRVRHVFRTDAVLGEQRGVHLAGDCRTVFVSHRPESYREHHIIATGNLKAYHIVPMTFWKPQKSIAAARCTV